MGTKNTKSTKTCKKTTKTCCKTAKKCSGAKKCCKNEKKHLIDAFGFEVAFAVAGLLTVMLFVFGTMLF